MTDARDDASERDAVIARVLDVVDPVDPAPGFWDEVEATLRGEQTAPVHELARVAGGRPGPSQADRRRWLGFAGAAAATVAVVALGAVAFLGDDPPSDPVLPPAASTTSSTASAEDARAAAAAAQAQDAADAWMLAASRGDAETMWARMGPQSQGSWSGLAAFADEVDQLGTAWAWRAGSPRPSMTAHEVGDGHDLYLVRVESASVRPPDLVVRLSPSGNPGAYVEPFLPGQALGLADLADRTFPKVGFAPIAIDADAAAWIVLVDGAVVHEPALRVDGDGAVTGVGTAPFAPGRHQLEVVVESADGTLLQAVSDLEVEALDR